MRDKKCFFRTNKTFFVSHYNLVVLRWLALGISAAPCVTVEWQSLLRVAQMCIVGSRAKAARSFLAAFLYVAWTLAIPFYTPALTLCRHVCRCLAISSHALV